MVLDVLASAINQDRKIKDIDIGKKGVKLLLRPFQIVSEVAQLCPTLCNPMDCSLPGSSVHGIFQAIVLEWIAISFTMDLPDPGIEPWSPAL